jgi:hypothetical protein
MRLFQVALLVPVLLAGCSSESSNPSGSNGGAGGTASTGGRTGAGGAGGGAGGMVAGGTTGGGGTTGSGGASAGGAGGAANVDGGNGAPDVPPDSGATNDGGAADMPGNSQTLDECFVGLRPFVESYQIATKRTTDSKYRVRLALERVPESAGTSGTVPWRVVRVGIQTPAGSLCIKDEAQLTQGYKGSHHNCMDVLTVASGGKTYKFEPPDTDLRPDNLRTSSMLTITATGSPVEKVTLSTEDCKSKSKAMSDQQCRSGGPCQ